MCFQVHVAYTLGSIAKGSDSHLKSLIDLGLVPVMLNSLLLEKNKNNSEQDNNPKLIEGVLSCLKTVFHHSQAPVELIYADEDIIPRLIHLMRHTGEALLIIHLQGVSLLMVVGKMLGTLQMLNFDETVIRFNPTTFWFWMHNC